MSFLEGIVEKVGVACGMDPDDAELLGDLASCGANIAMGNYAGAAADGLDAAGLDDDVPWLAQGLELAGGDPTSAGLDAGLGSGAGEAGSGGMGIDLSSLGPLMIQG
jgi:hypothetical protein